MKCPLQVLIQTEGNSLEQPVVKQTIDFIQCDVGCAWYDQVEKQCAVKSIAQSLKILATDHKAL